MSCHWCGRDSEPFCRNTRDMTDMAIAGNDICYASIEKLGGGEQGMEYIRKNRAEFDERQKEPPKPSDPPKQSEAPTAESRKKLSYVGVPAYWELQMACQELVRAYSNGTYGGCFLVGSVLERSDWRDVDVRFMLDDAEFNKLFPDAQMHWEADPRWLITCSSISLWLSKRTGLPIDFQFQPMTHANKVHGKALGKTRHSIGLIYAKEKCGTET